MAKRKFVVNRPLVFEREAEEEEKEEGRHWIIVDWEESEDHLLKAMDRSVRAADKGLSRYREARRLSMEEQDDGAIVDFVPNVMEGTAVMMRGLALVPLDVFRAGYTRRTRKLVARGVRSVARATG